MLIDLAVMSYYNALRVQAWIGDLALHIEHEFFCQEGPTAKLQQKWGYQVGDSSRRASDYPSSSCRCSSAPTGN